MPPSTATMNGAAACVFNVCEYLVYSLRRIHRSLIFWSGHNWKPRAWKRSSCLKNGSMLMPDRIHLFYLDRYHLEPLFIQTLARSITSAGADKRPAPRGLFVHGSGERAERMLEGEGFDVHRTQGVLEVHSAQEARIVHRAVVETNRAIAAILTNTVVPAVGLRGYDRHLIVDRPGGLEVQAPEW